MNVTRLEPYDTGHTERSEKDSRPRYMSGTTDAGETSDALTGCQCNPPTPSLLLKREQGALDSRIWTDCLDGWVLTTTCRI